jgi:methylmalonyl-CoA/ethylmalonyl-CoA epimerase
MSNSSDRIGISGIGQIAVNVHDLDRAVDFYRDVLGLRFLFRATNMAFFDCGGIRLMLAPPDKPELDHPASILYYRVDDINSAHAALKSRDVVFDLEPRKVHANDTHELWLAFFRDPDRNILALMSEVRL